MTDGPGDNDVVHPSQAEGEDPEAPEEEIIVLEAEGKPSEAEGEDPDHPDDVEVIDPTEPD